MVTALKYDIGQYIPFVFVIATRCLCRFSWIHVDDLVNLIYEALSNPSYKGKKKCTNTPVAAESFIQIKVCILYTK